MLLLRLYLDQPYLLQVFKHLLLLPHQLVMLFLEVLHVGYVFPDLADLLLTLAVLRLVDRHLVDQFVSLRFHFLDQLIRFALEVLGKVHLSGQLVRGLTIVVVVEELSTLSYCVRVLLLGGDEETSALADVFLAVLFFL